MQINKHYRILFITIALCFIVVSGCFAMSGSIGDSKVFYNVNKGIKIQIYDVKVTGFKGKKILFAFELSQDGEILEDSYVEVKEQVVKRDPVYWNKKAFHCKYSYDYLQKIGNPAKEYICTFYIIGVDNYDVIELYDIEFSISDKITFDEKESNKMTNILDNIIIEYRDAYGASIVIKNRVLYYTYVTETVYDNPLSAHGSSSYATREEKIDNNDLQDLLDTFYNNNWSALDASYGVAENERHYPETLRLKDSENDKIITYRSGQTEEKKLPEEYKTIKKSLFDLNEKYTK